MNRIVSRITAIIVMAVFMFGLTTCKKEKIAVPTVKIFEEAITVTITRAGVSAEVTDQGGAEVISRGFVYGLSGEAEMDTVYCGSGMGVFSAEFNDLQPNTSYVYEAFAKNEGGFGVSGKVIFTTLDHDLPTVKTNEVENVGVNTAKCGGNVTHDGGGATITERGICWGTNHNPTATGSHVSAGGGMGEFTCNMNNLSANTTYYVRAYAKNSKGTAYGEEKSFTTLDYDMPEVTTANVTEITQTTAKGGGEVTNDGGTNVTERGICWSTSHNPTTSDSHVASGTGMGAFNSNITGLSPHTKYYVRAYAINSKGTVYGNEVYFTTLATPPTVSTGEVTDITTTSAKGSGNVTDNGGSAVTECGLCWSTNHTPTVNDSHVISIISSGVFTLTMTNLSANTTYYVRAYATNDVGTTYGEEVEFETLSQTLPTVTTLAVTNITQTTAKCGGNVISDGGATVTERGICWSTSHNPTLSNDYAAASSGGTGTFTVIMTNLTPNTNYYVRAYAKNSQGTEYGEEAGFTTENVGMPSVTTNEVTNITQTTATCGGNVVSNGGSPLTARGVCWGTSPSPTPTVNYTLDGTSTGSFVSQIRNLTPGVMYYIRAYATNSVGTSYGEERSFITTSSGAWIYYDDGNYATNVGTNNAEATIHWASMFPASILSQYAGTSLTKVAVYENSYNTNNITVRVYLGGTTSPQTLKCTKTFSPVGGNAFHEVTLATPVNINGNQNLWIVFSEMGDHPATACIDVGNANNRWISLDGSTWQDLDAAGLPGYGWMIRGWVTNGKGEGSWVDLKANESKHQAPANATTIMLE